MCQRYRGTGQAHVSLPLVFSLILLSAIQTSERETTQSQSELHSLHAGRSPKYWKIPPGSHLFSSTFLKKSFFLPAYKHRDTELQQSGRAGSRDVLHAEYGECQFVFPNLAVICFHCCACRAAAGNCVSAWCVVVNDDPINQSINKNLRRERTALDKPACAD